MRFNLFLFSLVVTIVFSVVSCGEDDTEYVATNELKSTSLNFTPVAKVKEVKTFRPVRHPGANIQRWPMIATGQTKCYDHKSEIICPSFGERYYGQDGQMQMGTRSYVTTNPETITDSVTLLMWARAIKTNVTWYEAQTYCSSLALAGKKWRLPLTHELRSIVDYGAVDPAIDTSFYKVKQGSVWVVDEELKKSLSDWFWSSKHTHFNQETETGTIELSAAWIVSFYDGFVEYTARYNIYNVRCVSDQY